MTKDKRYSLRWATGCVALVLMACVFPALALPTVDPIFRDAMVLQCEADIPVSGEAEPGAKVHIVFANQSVVAKAGADGRWRATLSPSKATTTPQALQVKSNGKAVVINDILVGEVWLLAGQSNMDFQLGSCIGAKKLIDTISTNNAIRLLDPATTTPGGKAAWPLATCKRLTPQNYFKAFRWVHAEANNVSSFSGVGAVFALRMQERLGLPIGVIDVSVGGSPTESWLARETLLADPELAPLELEFPDSIMSHDFVYTRPRQHLGNWLKAGRPGPVPEHPYRAGFLYEAGLKPFGSLPIAGILWYQGESNAHDATLHNKLFTLAAASWRELFNDQDLPIFWVQLPELNRESWPEFRQAQQVLTQTIPNTAMAVALGNGHPTDVHPRDKAPVGDRLARLALKRVYHIDIEDSGPTLVQAQRVGESMQLQFDHVSGGLDLRLPGNDEPRRDLPTGFWIAGQDKVFYPAFFQEKQGNMLWLTHPKVGQPISIRYAWEANVKPTLFNGEGLPVAPFRTDDWDPIRIACVGDSITFGTGTRNPDTESYPSQLSQIVGPLFDVRGFGAPGSSVVDGLIQAGTGWNRGFINQRVFHSSLLFEPDVVIINLGINDVVNEDFNIDIFVTDYVALINAYRSLPSTPTVVIWNRLAPLFPGQTFYNNPRLKKIQKALDKVVAQAGVETIDMYEPLINAAKSFPDRLHPNAQGAKLIAQQTCDKLKQLKLPVAGEAE